jgi:diaminohydroxyphosphoribosylaminopyrimidine deaminase/5-amino-6-(5-phosphoribosylamino)uracil reductase
MSRPSHLNAARKEAIMRRCLELARQGWGTTHPNPMVGAAIVEKGEIVAEGFHARAGKAHAEVAALQALGRAPEKGATLFVTLEPCSTHGRTPPCTEALIAAGLKHVVVGAFDPNPEHEGRGLDVLKAAGVSVESRVLADECADLNLIFNHWIAKQRPLIAAKVATTLDGRIATRGGDSQWITGDAARADVHQWRRLFPAIAVGAGTVIRDNPKLTARVADAREWCPLRLVFDGHLRTASATELPGLYTDSFKDHTIVVAWEQSGTGYIRRLEQAGVRVWALPGIEGRISFAAFRERCVKEEITGVYVEGGAQLLSELLYAREIDYLFAYRAPLLFADERAKSVIRGLRTERLDHAIRLERVHHATFGDDVMSRGFVAYPGKLIADETVLGHG